MKNPKFVFKCVFYSNADVLNTIRRKMLAFEQEINKDMQIRVHLSEGTYNMPTRAPINVRCQGNRNHNMLSRKYEDR